MQKLWSRPGQCMFAKQKRVLGKVLSEYYSGEERTSPPLPPTLRLDFMSRTTVTSILSCSDNFCPAMLYVKNILVISEFYLWAWEVSYLLYDGNSSENDVRIMSCLRNRCVDEYSILDVHNLTKPSENHKNNINGAFRRKRNPTWTHITLTFFMSSSGLDLEAAILLIDVTSVLGTWCHKITLPVEQRVQSTRKTSALEDFRFLTTRN